MGRLNKYHDQVRQATGSFLSCEAEALERATGEKSLAMRVVRKLLSGEGLF